MRFLGASGELRPRLERNKLELMKLVVAPHALEVCRRLVEAGHSAQIVGGCVRDLLLGRTAKDWDVATSGRPEAVQRLFKDRKSTRLNSSH